MGKEADRREADQKRRITKETDRSKGGRPEGNQSENGSDKDRDKRKQKDDKDAENQDANSNASRRYPEFRPLREWLRRQRSPESESSRDEDNTSEDRDCDNESVSAQRGTDEEVAQQGEQGKDEASAHRGTGERPGLEEGGSQSSNFKVLQLKGGGCKCNKKASRSTESRKKREMNP